MVISPENCEEIAQCRRIKAMEFIRVGNFTFDLLFSHYNAIRLCLSEIAQRGDLAVKTLKFSGSKFGVKISLPLDLSSLRLLAGKVANLDLSSVTLTTAELNVLLTALSATTTDSQKRRSLNIRKSSVARISLQPDQFADIVVNKLDELKMSGTNPSEDLLTAVLKEISRGESRLRSLSMGDNINISQVQSDLLATAVSQLTEVNLSGSALSCHQTEAVLQEIIAARVARLEVLSLGNTNMFEVDSGTLGRAICRVRKAQIWNSRLNLHQIKDICQFIYKTKDRRLQHLDLESHDVIYKTKESKKYFLAVCSLRSVDLHNCKVTLPKAILSYCDDINNLLVNTENLKVGADSWNA